MSLCVLAQVIDSDRMILACQGMDTEPEGKENASNVAHPKECKHIGCLSVDTQWDSQFVESLAVKSTHLNTVRDWRSEKMLDLLISGRLKEVPIGTSLEFCHEGTDKLVANSLQNILSNVSWLWSVAVGDNMLDNVHDVVSNTSSNLDSLIIDFVENSAGFDIPLSVRLSSSQTNDDYTGSEVVAEQEIDKLDDWLCDEVSVLLDGLAANLDDEREKVLNHKVKSSVTDVTEASAASFSSLLEHAINASENADDLYSPAHPTEMELASTGGNGDIRRLQAVSVIENKTELQFPQSADINAALNDLAENSATSRRTVRIHKKENVDPVEESSRDRIKGSTHKHRQRKSSSKKKWLPAWEEDLENISSQVSDTVVTDDKAPGSKRIENSVSVSEELLQNQLAEMSNAMEVATAVDSVPTDDMSMEKQMQDNKSVDRHVGDLTDEFNSSVENQFEVNTCSLATPVESHKTKSSKKHSRSRSDAFVESYGCDADVKKGTGSSKRKERSVDATTKKSKKKVHDIGRQIDRQLKLNVKSELNHVQKSIESLLYENCGISGGNTTKLSRALSLSADESHFSVLSGLSLDVQIALMAFESEDDSVLKAEYLTPLLNDLLTELHIPLSVLDAASGDVTGNLMGKKVSVELKHAVKPQLESPSSPPTLRNKRSKQTKTVSHRKKSIEEMGTSIPQQRQETPVTENEKRLMKADKLMQTFRRSQIAKRQSQRTSPQPPASFIKQVQAVPQSEASQTASAVDSPTTASSLEPREPDFSTVITDGNMLALVELPQIPAKLLPQTDVPDAPVLSQTLSPTLPQAAFTVTVSTNDTPGPLSATTICSSVEHATPSVIIPAGKEERVFVFNNDKPLCQEVEVCLNMFLSFEFF